ncbi:MAG: hypothetical protein OEV42_02770 [Deltaproteobacteria bacterium]|nr:hypothetical protein [Deltaproteobacteria bacterium]
MKIPAIERLDLKINFYKKAETLYIVTISLILYVTAFITRWPLVHKMFNGYILDEELNCAFGAVLSLESLQQFNYFDSNFGAYLLFWLSSHSANFDLYYSRETKLLISSFLPVISFLFCKYRLNLSLSSSFICALFLVFNPTLINYSIIGIDMGMELVPGVLALYLIRFKTLNNDKLRVTAVFFLSAMAASIYGAGFAFFPTALWWAIYCHRGSDLFRLGRGAIYGLLGVTIYIWPYFLISGNPIPSRGAGNYCPDYYCIIDAISLIGKDLFIKPTSYLNFGDFPSFGILGAAIFFVPFILGIIKLYSTIMRDQSILIGLTILSAIAVLLLSGDHSGIRRGLILIVLIFFVVAIGLDVIFQHLKNPIGKFALVFLLTIMLAVRGHAILDNLSSIEYAGIHPSRYEDLIKKLENNDLTLRKTGSVNQTYSVLKLICMRRGLKCRDILIVDPSNK